MLLLLPDFAAVTMLAKWIAFCEIRSFCEIPLNIASFSFIYTLSQYSGTLAHCQLLGNFVRYFAFAD